MIYEYQCSSCNLSFDIVKPASEYKTKEQCVKCGSEMQKVFGRIYLSGTSNEFASFDPAFGQVIKNKYHRKEEARKKGLIEVGSENLEKIDKQYARERTQRQEKKWDEALSEGLANV